MKTFFSFPPPLALPFPGFLQIKGKSRVDQGKGLFFFLCLQKQRKKEKSEASNRAKVMMVYI